MVEHALLVQLVQAACVLDGVDAEPTADGVLVGGARTVSPIPWPDIEGVLAGDDPVAPGPRLRLALLLELRRAVDARGADAAADVARAVRVLALPVGHPLHPGAGWVRHRVPGGLLEVGLGVHGLLRGQDGVLPLPPAIGHAVDAGDLWTRAWSLGERLAHRAVARLDGSPRDHLGGVGGCDALTLLALPALRERVAGAGPVAAPCRDGVWLGAAAADRDYVRAVWMLTGAGRRGLPRPVVVDGSGVRSPAARHR